MGKYLKMADVFCLPLCRFIDDESIGNVVDASGASIVYIQQTEKNRTADGRNAIAEYAAHAINSNDELVAEVERLRGALQDAYLDGCHYGWGMSANGYNSEYGGPNDWRLNNSFIESYSPDKYIIE